MDQNLARELVKKVLPSYEIYEMIGEGSFGVVFRMQDSLKERAVKIILLSATPSIEKGEVTSPKTKIERDFRHIVESYERIECEEIVTVYDFYKVSDDEDKKQASAYAIVVMELYPSNLHEYIIDDFQKNNSLLAIETVNSLMEKLAVLLGNLYTKRGFLFEDIKPENILIKEQAGELKLVVGDIGGLKSLGSATATGSQVTLSYSAPEVIRRGQKPDLKSIIYSYGLLSHFFLEGRLPYESYGVGDRMDLIKDKGLFLERKDVPDNLRKIIECCLSFEPEDRYAKFDDILDAIHGKVSHKKDKTFEETVDLNSFKKQISQIPGTVKERSASGIKQNSPFNALKGISPVYQTVSHRTLSETKKRTETIKLSDEKDEIQKIDNEIRDLVIREGDIYKLQNQSCKIYNDIKLENGAILLIENAKLYFDENAGIISTGTLRAKNSLFSAIDPIKKWRNISLCTNDTRANYFEGCSFRFGRGRTWESMKSFFHVRSYPLNNNYLYGGALFIAGVKENIISIKDCNFTTCFAQEGGGIFCLKSQPLIENCAFDNCSSALTGGAICNTESNSIIKRCKFVNCHSSREGGGISCITSEPIIDSCTFDGCSTKHLYGGGIFSSGSRPTIKSCRFNRCTASKDGGGIYFDDKSNPRIIIPCLYKL